MAIDTETLSRAQFAITIAFHILFPAFSIGLASFLAVFEGAWLKTKNPLYLVICKFWTKIFALTFGMGVVSGIVMEFQLGTNWSGYSHAVGAVLGPLFTYEVMTAFFIEAGFLGVMILGWDRVGSKLHFTATVLVVIGVTLSAFWINSANSWMQTPAGAHLDSGLFIVDSWLDVILNPSAFVRFSHMLIAAYVCTAFAIASVCAHYLINKIHVNFAKCCFNFSLLALIILMPLQIYLGDESGIIVHEHQPIKTAAIEGVWKTEKGAPLLLFAWPDQANQKNLFTLSIPKLASLINTHELDGELTGLSTVALADQPNVPLVFWAFRVMVGLGLLMLLTAIVYVALRWRGIAHNQSWYLFWVRAMAPAGFIAMIAGWVTAEAGRQPWVVYNALRTIDAASNVPLHNVVASFVLILLVYGILFGIFYFKYFFFTLNKGPADLTSISPPFVYMDVSNPKQEKQ